MSDFGPNAMNAHLLSPEMKEALKDFIADVAQQSRKQAALVDLLVGAVKAVSQDLQQEKLRTQMLDARVQGSEARLDELARAVDALRRQGWVQ
jgi:hypothetical protein